MTYCWRCPSCGETKCNNDRSTPPTCQQGDELMIRDYRAENVGISSTVKVSQGGDLATKAKSIIPQRQFFEKRYGAHGEKRVAAEINKWNNEHEPTHSHGNRYRPKA